MAIRQDPRQRGKPEHVGTFLVASPYAGRTPVARTVVLLLEHHAEGALGLVLDRTIHQAIRDLHAESASRQPGYLEIPARMRLGLMAWGPGELDAERQQGIWLAAPASMAALFGDGDLWVELVRRVGRKVLSDTLRIDGTDVNPALN